MVLFADAGRAAKREKQNQERFIAKGAMEKLTSLHRPTRSQEANAKRKDVGLFRSE
jgi:hypothetical protein